MMLAFTGVPISPESLWLAPSCSAASRMTCNTHGALTKMSRAAAAWDAASETCSCLGNYIGEMCFTLCDCSGRGTQHAIEEARVADSCGAGSCSCQQGFYGEFCQQGAAGG